MGKNLENINGFDHKKKVDNTLSTAEVVKKGNQVVQNAMRKLREQQKGVDLKGMPSNFYHPRYPEEMPASARRRHDIAQKYYFRRKTPIQYQGRETLTQPINDAVERGESSFHRRADVPSRGIFDKSIIYIPPQTFKKLDKDNPVKTEVDIFCHGVGGNTEKKLHEYYRRLRARKDRGQYRIGFFPEDGAPSHLKNNKRPRFNWNNLKVLSPAQRERAIKHYLTELITMTEAQGCRVKNLNIYGLSSGGRAAQYFSEVAVNGWIKLTINGKERSFFIKRKVNFDAGYFENLDFFHTYYSHAFKEALLKNSNIQKRVNQYHLALINKQPTQLLVQKLTEEIKLACQPVQLKLAEQISREWRRGRKGDRKGLNRSQFLNVVAQQSKVVQGAMLKYLLSGKPLSDLKLSKYYAVPLDSMWTHQDALSTFLRKLAKKYPNGKYGVRVAPLHTIKSHVKSASADHLEVAHQHGNSQPPKKVASFK